MFDKKGKSTLQKLADVKLTLLLLIILAIFTIPGMVLVQNLEQAKYVQQFGSFWGKVIVATNAKDTFNSLWFNLALAALCVNLFACISTKLLRMFKTSFVVKVYSDLSKLDSANNSVLIQSNYNSSQIQDVLKKRFSFGVNRFSTKTENNRVFFAAKTGQFSVIGSLILHIGLLVIVGGGLIDKFGGEKTYLRLDKGESLPVFSKDFEVKLNSFELVRGEHGSIKDFLSHLSIFEGNNKILDKTIEVNDPLFYKGVFFYQSSYGTYSGAVGKFKVNIKEIEGRKIDTLVYFNNLLDTLEILPGLRLNISNFVSDFSIDSKSKQVVSSSSNHKNPAIRLVLSKDEKVLGEGWLFKNFPDFHGKSKLIAAEFVDYENESEYYTVLQASTDPGLSLKWIGIIMMSLGLIFVFYITPSSYSGYWEESSDGCLCFITGRSHRAGKNIGEEVNKIKNSLEGKND